MEFSNCVGGNGWNVEVPLIANKLLDVGSYADDYCLDNSNV